MSKNIILKKKPKIEFQLLENGFNLIDGQTEKNSGFYSYQKLQSVKINNPWFPRLAKSLRFITWIFNGVPFFPDAETYKKASIIFNYKTTRIGIWLIDSYMADNARILEKLLNNKIKHNIA